MYIPDIQDKVEPSVIDSTPNVLSVGKRCQSMGWGFYWRPWSAHPIFVDPNGRVIVLNTEGFIPYLQTKSTAVAATPTLGRSLTESEATPAQSSTTDTYTCAQLKATPLAANKEAQEEESDGEEIQEFDTRGMCERDLREEAVSIEHLMTHFPKNPYCDACQRARIRRKANRRRKEPREMADKSFGKSVTLDHTYAHTETMEGIDGSLDMCIIYDVGTEKIDAYPARSKNADDTRRYGTLGARPTWSWSTQTTPTRSKRQLSNLASATGPLSPVSLKQTALRRVGCALSYMARAQH